MDPFVQMYSPPPNVADLDVVREAAPRLSAPRNRGWLQQSLRVAQARRGGSGPAARLSAARGEDRPAKRQRVVTEEPARAPPQDSACTGTPRRRSRRSVVESARFSPGHGPASEWREERTVSQELPAVSAPAPAAMAAPAAARRDTPAPAATASVPKGKGRGRASRPHKERAAGRPVAQSLESAERLEARRELMPMEQREAWHDRRRAQERAREQKRDVELECQMEKENRMLRPMGGVPDKALGMTETTECVDEMEAQGDQRLSTEQEQHEDNTMDIEVRRCGALCSSGVAASPPSTDYVMEDLVCAGGQTPACMWGRCMTELWRYRATSTSTRDGSSDTDGALP